MSEENEETKAESIKKVLEEIADPDNWNTFLMWPGPAAQVIIQWRGKPGIRARAQEALEEMKNENIS